MTEQEVRRYLRQMKEESSERAFKGFYDLTYDRLFRIAYYYLKHEEWAQEVVLDVFLTLWKQRDTLAAVQNIEDYCFILTRNASLNYLEKEVRRSDSLSADLTESDASDPSPEECLISEEKQSYAQVAEELGISVKTVDAQLQKAVSRLRDMLK